MEEDEHGFRVKDGDGLLICAVTHRDDLHARHYQYADGGTELWVPDLNLPIADMLPTGYVQSDAVRLEILAVSPDAAPRMISRIWRTKPHVVSAGCRRKRASFSRWRGSG